MSTGLEVTIWAATGVASAAMAGAVVWFAVAVARRNRGRMRQAAGLATVAAVIMVFVGLLDADPVTVTAAGISAATGGLSCWRLRRAVTRVYREPWW